MLALRNTLVVEDLTRSLSSHFVTVHRSNLANGATAAPCSSILLPVLVQLLHLKTMFSLRGLSAFPTSLSLIEVPDSLPED